jgi:uncharacterized membrane protein YgcG
MKTKYFQRASPFIAAAVALVIAAGTVSAQDNASPATPQLTYGVSQVVQLSKANIGEDTIVTYVQNSGNSYGLDADQIVYLKQQGVSANVINAMINQRNRPVASAPVSTATDSQASYTAPASTVNFVQTAPAYVPASTVYVMPDTQTYDYYSYYHPYYPYYYGWPAVSLSFGWGGRWGGGYYGGWHGGGGFHGGGGRRR